MGYFFCRLIVLFLIVGSSSFGREIIEEESPLIKHPNSSDLLLPSLSIQQDLPKEISTRQKILGSIFVGVGAFSIPVSVVLAVRGAKKFTQNEGAEIYFGWICSTAALMGELIFPKWDMAREVVQWQAATWKDKAVNGIRFGTYYTIGMFAGIWMVSTTYEIFYPYLGEAVWGMAAINFFENFNTIWAFIQLENLVKSTFFKRGEKRSLSCLSRPRPVSNLYYITEGAAYGLGTLGLLSAFYNYDLGLNGTLKTLALLGIKGPLLSSVLSHISGVCGIAIGAIFRAKGCYGIMRDGIDALQKPRDQSHQWTMKRIIGTTVKQATILSLCIGAALPSSYLSYINLSTSGSSFDYMMTALNFGAGVLMSHWLMDKIVSSTITLIGSFW